MLALRTIMSSFPDKTSYSIKNFITNVEAELIRLKAQIDLFWDKEVRAYQRFGLTDGMKILGRG